MFAAYVNAEVYQEVMQKARQKTTDVLKHYETKLTEKKACLIIYITAWCLSELFSGWPVCLTPSCSGFKFGWASMYSWSVVLCWSWTLLVASHKVLLYIGHSLYKWNLEPDHRWMCQSSPEVVLSAILYHIYWLIILPNNLMKYCSMMLVQFDTLANYWPTCETVSSQFVQ